MCLAAMLLPSCDDSRPVPQSSPVAWTIGPVINGKNYSGGMPPRPASCAPAVLCVDLPGGSQSHAHYVTRASGPLAGKTRIRMRYRVEMADNVQIVPKADPRFPSMITLYFQRRGDDFSAKGKYEAYRWYASFATQTPITTGEHEIIAPFLDVWTAVLTSTSETAPDAFRVAMAEAESIGFVLGGANGLGHGVYSVGGPARIIVDEFDVR